MYRSGGETLAMGPILNGRRVVQVYQEVRQAGAAAAVGEDEDEEREFTAGVRLLDASLGALQEVRACVRACVARGSDVFVSLWLFVKSAV